MTHTVYLLINDIVVNVEAWYFFFIIVNFDACSDVQMDQLTAIGLQQF